MAKYLIHACQKRMWYVNEYMIPSMEAQGISAADITVSCDTEGKGILYMFMDSLDDLPQDGDTWHLQDDILIASTFKEETEKERTGIICGLCTVYDKDREPGWTDVFHIWYSFPCIRIPNKLAHDLHKWFYEYANVTFDSVDMFNWRKHKACDDMFFRIFIEKYYKDEPVLNLAPNIIDHVDYLIGGSIMNYGTAENFRGSRFWYEPELTDKLMKEMMKRCEQESA